MSAGVRDVILIALSSLLGTTALLARILSMRGLILLFVLLAPVSPISMWCKNGGARTTNGQPCSCPPGYYGPSCEYVDCVHGRSHFYGCLCDQGWTGKFCNISLCVHGTWRWHVLPFGRCACADGWEGASCDRIKCDRLSKRVSATECACKYWGQYPKCVRFVHHHLVMGGGKADDRVLYAILGVVGGIFGLGLLALVGYLCYRSYKKHKAVPAPLPTHNQSAAEDSEAPPTYSMVVGKKE